MSYDPCAAEQVMDELWSAKDKGFLDPALETFGQLDYGTEVTEFVLDKESYFFPKFIGTALVEEVINSDKIAVVCLPNGTYRGEKPRLHPLQRTALKESGASAWDIRDADREFAGRDGTFSPVKSVTVPASVYRQQATVGKQPPKVIESKPMVIFDSGLLASVENPTAPDVVLHELVHVAQTLASPVHESNPTLQRELEAFAVQAKLVDEYRLRYSSSLEMAGTVDRFRQYNLGADNYVPTPEFVRAMAIDPVVAKINK